MNNEEKARQIIGEDCRKERCLECGGRYSAEKGGCVQFQKIMEMAQWKDEQFDKKLQEIVDYVYPRIFGGERLHINEIIGKDMVWKH